MYFLSFGDWGENTFLKKLVRKLVHKLVRQIALVVQHLKLDYIMLRQWYFVVWIFDYVIIWYVN